IMRRYESLVQASAQIVWVSDAEGDVIEPSPQWERVTGQSWEELRGDGWLQVVHPDDREPTLEAWSRALEQVPDVWENGYRLRTVHDGSRHSQTRAVPILEEGRVGGWVAIGTAIEEQWARQRRQRLLARANDAMVTGMSLEQTLRARRGHRAGTGRRVRRPPDRRSRRRAGRSGTADRRTRRRGGGTGT